MTELEIPPDATEETASRLVAEFADVGDEVEIWDSEMTDTDGDDRARAHGTITAIEPGYVEIDGEGPDGEGIRYDEIHTMARIDTA
ncbi:hypothetical protein [Halovivax sp.]|uniref:hypothetical protein n=1 Tax=Halovivax sp. TaxID=1935978 RepID=UPI0025B82968|nr:hypothetical protein [Halovivax sp.]